jgi:phospholipase D-like protein
MARRNKKSWSDLTPTQRKIVVVTGILELVLTAAATRDLKRRPRHQVRGPKPLWLLAFSVQPFGPLAYFAVGRRTSD